MAIFNRKYLVQLARLLLTVMLFAQYSLATQACMMPEPAPAMAFMASAMPNCAMHDMGNPNPNACFVHCTSDYQTLDSHHAGLDLPAMLPVLLLFPAVSAVPPHQLTYHPVFVARVTGPPPYLRHQNFRI
jgi:hypothetical protein